MKAWIISRRLRRGQDQEFRQRWAESAKPKGMKEAYLLEEGANAQESMSVSLWESADALTAYRASDAARQRQEGLGDLVEHEEWSRVYDAWPAEGRQSGKRPLLRVLPPLVGVAGVAGLLIAQAVNRRNQGIVEKSRQAAVSQTRRRNPWLLLPAVLLPVGAATFFVVRRLLSRGEQPEIDEELIIFSEPERPLATLDAVEAETRNQPQAQTIAGGLAQTQPGANASAARGLARDSETTTATAAEPARPIGALVSDHMTAVAEAAEYDAFVTITEARMRELGVDALPVVADGQLAGIITRGDLAKSMAGGEPPPEHDRVVDYMTEVPVTIAPDASLDEATRLMANHKIHHLIVVDGTQPVGVFSGERRDGGQSAPASQAERERSPSQIVVEPARDSGH